jgi:hypothetical protein
MFKLLSSPAGNFKTNIFFCLLRYGYFFSFLSSKMFCPILIPRFCTNVEGDVLLAVLHFSYLIFTFAFISNLLAKLYKLIQGRGDYNAKLGVTILGTFLNIIFIFFINIASVRKYKILFK